jgi:hypothetical protein
MKIFKKRRPSAPSKAAKRKRNWAQINTNLVRRGDLTIWIDPEIAKAWNHPSKTGRPGRPREYSDLAIVTAHTLKSVYGLRLRQLEGFLGSIIRLIELPLTVPDFSTFSRRLPSLTVRLPKRKSPNESIHMVIDSTGLKIYGAGEWHAYKHGLRKRRSWRKLHLLIDADTCDILDAELTKNSVDDGCLLPYFLGRTEENVEALSADGAYDTEACYAALAQKNIRAVIPPRSDAVHHKEDDACGAWALRNRNLNDIQAMGLEKWKHKNGYYRQSKAENGMYRYKTIFGDRLSSRAFASQKNEVLINCMILNRMNQRVT